MDRQYVGIDFHRRRSVIVRLSADGERLGVHRIVNDPFELSAVVGLRGLVHGPQLVRSPRADRLPGPRLSALLGWRSTWNGQLWNVVAPIL